MFNINKKVFPCTWTHWQLPINHVYVVTSRENCKKCSSFLQIFSKKINGLKNLSFWDVFIEFYGFCPDSGLKDPDPKQCFFVLYDPLWAAALYLSKLLVRAPLFSISWSMASWRPPPSPPPPRPPRSSSCSRWRCLFASIYEDAATKLFNRI